MDPDACLADATWDAQEGRYGTALLGLRDYAAWRQSGGVPADRDTDLICAILVMLPAGYLGKLTMTEGMNG